MSARMPNLSLPSRKVKCVCLMAHVEVFHGKMDWFELETTSIRRCLMRQLKKRHDVERCPLMQVLEGGAAPILCVSVAEFSARV